MLLATQFLTGFRTTRPSSLDETRLQGISWYIIKTIIHSKMMNYHDSLQAGIGDLYFRHLSENRSNFGNFPLTTEAKRNSKQSRLFTRSFR